MLLHVLDTENTVLNNFIAELRDIAVQTDRMRFRRNLERAGEIMAYEISKTFDYAPSEIETQLGVAEMMLPRNEVIIATILRAGIPYHQGFLNYFDRAENAFISAYRKYSKDGTFNIKVEYVQCGDLSGKTLILADPMLATGSSVVLTYKALEAKGGEPSHVHIATIVASEEGIEYIKRNMPSNKTTVWCGAIDQELTVKSYIVPGIGDVGDLAYGEKAIK